MHVYSAQPTEAKPNQRQVESPGVDTKPDQLDRPLARTIPDIRPGHSLRAQPNKPNGVLLIPQDSHLHELGDYYKNILNRIRKLP